MQLRGLAQKNRKRLRAKNIGSIVQKQEGFSIFFLLRIACNAKSLQNMMNLPSVFIS